MQSSVQRFVFDLLKLGAILLFVVVPIRVYVAQPFIVSGASMAPTFESGQYLIVDQLSYHFNDPRRGDIVIFRFPYNPDTFFIKRIIGLPGETVVLDDGTVRIINEANPDGITIDEPYVTQHAPNGVSATTNLQDGEYFVLGDNRSASSDSRKWGPLPERFIVGEALLRLLPAGELGVYPGATSFESATTNSQ